MLLSVIKDAHRWLILTSFLVPYTPFLDVHRSTSIFINFPYRTRFFPKPTMFAWCICLTSFSRFSTEKPSETSVLASVRRFACTGRTPRKNREEWEPGRTARTVRKDREEEPVCVPGASLILSMYTLLSLCYHCAIRLRVNMSEVFKQHTAIWKAFPVGRIRVLFTLRAVMSSGSHWRAKNSICCNR